MGGLESHEPLAGPTLTRMLAGARNVLVALALTGGAAFSAETFAQGRLSDGSDGVTCRYFSAAGRLAWSQPGGDWTDSAGVLHGDRPFASVAAPTNAGQISALDVTGLLQQLHHHADGFGGLIVRYLGDGGAIVYHSRESPDPHTRPQLELQLSDGVRRTLAPVADTVLDCSTVRPLGSGSTFRVSSKHHGLLEFDVAEFDLSRIVQATLRLSAERVSSRPGGDIAVFMVTLPGAGGDRDDTERAGLAQRYPNDKGIESDPAVFFAAGFEHASAQHGWTLMGSKSQAKLVSDGEGNGFEPLQGQALKVTLIPEQNLGLDLRYDFAREVGEEPTEAYLRYYMMFGLDWQPDVDGGKLPGFAGTYNQGGWGRRRSDGTNGWSIRGGFARQARAASQRVAPVAIGSYAYHADLDGRSGAYWGWNLGPTGMLDPGKWYAIEQYVRLNTPGRNDGIFRAWIDGQVVFERTDLRFRDVDALKIENAWFNVYHGGTAKPPREMSLYLDNVVIAREYIGPMVR
jgi:hypothetical protein